jgi:hypothetical protein
MDLSSSSSNDPLIIRLVIAMTLLPGSCYAEAMRTLVGLLAASRSPWTGTSPPGKPSRNGGC